MSSLIVSLLMQIIFERLGDKPPPMRWRDDTPAQEQRETSSSHVATLDDNVNEGGKIAMLMVLAVGTNENQGSKGGVST